MSNASASDLVAQLEDESQRLSALRGLAVIAEQNRLECALAGALPLASSMFQEAEEGSPIEAASMALLNNILVKDNTLPFFIATLVDVVRNHETADPLKLLHATGALGIINHRVYHPSAKTQETIGSCLPQLVALVQHPDAHIVSHVCRIIGGFGDSDEGTQQLPAMMAALPALSAVYQAAAGDSPVETAAISAINKLLQVSRDDEARVSLVKSLLKEAKSSKSQAQAVTALAVMLAEAHAPLRAQYEEVASHFDDIAHWVLGPDADTAVAAAALASRFKDGPITLHLKVFASGLFTAIRQRAHIEKTGGERLGSGQWTVTKSSSTAGSGATSNSPRRRESNQVQQACFAAADKLLYRLPLGHRDKLLEQLLTMWNEGADEQSLCNASHIVPDVVSPRALELLNVDAGFFKLIHHVTEGKGHALKVAACQVLHQLVMHSEILKTKALHRATCPALLAMLKSGTDDLMEAAALVLVTLSCSTVGSDMLADDAQLFLSVLKKKPGVTLELCVVGILGNLATFAHTEKRLSLVKCGTLDALLPLVRASGDGRRAAAAAVAMASLLGCVDDEHRMQGDDKLIGLVISALEATVAGQEFQGMMFETWALTSCIQQLCMSDVNKQFVARKGGCAALLRVLRMGDARSQLLAAQAFWNLAFAVDIERVCPGVLDALRSVASQEGEGLDDVRSMCAGAVFQAEEKTRRNSEWKRQARSNTADMPEKDIGAGGSTPVNTTNKLKTHSCLDHVVLLYHWPQQRLVLKVAEELEQNGIVCWVDIRELVSISLEAVAKAIDQSSAVAMLVSDQFQASEFCRSLAQYSFRRGRIVAAATLGDLKQKKWLADVLDGVTTINTSTPDGSDAAEKLRHALQSLKPDIAGTTEADTSLQRANHRAQVAEHRLRVLEQRVSVSGEEPFYNNLSALANAPGSPVADAEPSRSLQISDSTIDARQQPRAQHTYATAPSLVRTTRRQPSIRPNAVAAPRTGTIARGAVIGSAGAAASNEEVLERLREMDEKLDRILAKKQGCGCSIM